MKRPFLKTIQQIKSDIKSNALAYTVAQQRLLVAQNQPSKDHYQTRVWEIERAIKIYQRELELIQYIDFLEKEIEDLKGFAEEKYLESLGID